MDSNDDILIKDQFNLEVTLVELMERRESVEQGSSNDNEQDVKRHIGSMTKLTYKKKRFYDEIVA